MFLKWEITKSKVMCCVGDKESGELENDRVDSCSWVDKRLSSMNGVFVSCKWVVISVSNHDFCQNHDVQEFQGH